MEVMDQEVSEIRVELSKLPDIEETLVSLSKSIERLGVQAEKQQVMLTTIVVDLARGQKGIVGEDSGSRSGTNGVFGILEVKGTTELQPEIVDATVDRNKFKKVEMPVFSGVDPDGWLFRAERYFHIHKLTELEKMTVAVISFDGVALDWYQAQEERDSFADWKNLKKQLLMHFSFGTGWVALLSIFGD